MSAMAATVDTAPAEPPTYPASSGQHPNIGQLQAETGMGTGTGTGKTLTVDRRSYQDRQCARLAVVTPSEIAVAISMCRDGGG